jgi:hypothetical protein
MPDSGPSSVAYCTVDNRLYLTFEGGATHRASLTAEPIVYDFLATNPTTPQIVLDMDGCPWIDSTFAGWMVRVRQRAAAVQGVTVVSRCPDACRTSLDVMGLKPLFCFSDMTPPGELAECPYTAEGADAATIDFMLQAHEELADASPDNRERFGHVAEKLREELRHRQS